MQKHQYPSKPDVYWGDFFKEKKDWVFMDNVPDFKTELLCPRCNHLLYDKHMIIKYKADDLKERDLMVSTCTEKGCRCFKSYFV